MKERRIDTREGPGLGARPPRVPRSLQGLLLAGLLVLAVLAIPTSALALGPNAMIYPTGWNNNAVTRGDDNTYPTVNLPFSMKWNNTTYNSVYVNMNGNCTFGAQYLAWDPAPALNTLGANIMAPYWADVDTRNTTIPTPQGLCYYSDAASSTACVVNGHKAFVVTWQGVASYNQDASPLDYFQLVIIDRSDTGAGNFDFEYNYDQLTWDKGTGYTTNPQGHARMGWSFADGSACYETPNSGIAGDLLDTGPSSSSLIQNSLNSGGQLGRYVFSVRNGTLANVPPSIAKAFDTKTLEANTGPATVGYTGYSGATDATATDGDGTVVSFTRSPAIGAFLPIGSNVVTWTATDNDGAVTVATQTIVVQDTTPPTQPWAWSPTHVASQWSGVGTMTADWDVSTDAAYGTAGYSYSWSQNAPALPNTTIDAYTYTAGVTTTTVVENQPFASGTTFPIGGWVTGGTDPTYARISTTRFHLAANSAEVYAASTTRRTAQFSKTFDLSSYDSAAFSFWDYRTALTLAADYELVDYSTDGGTTWTVLQQTLGPSVLQGWTQHTYSLPCVANVTVRFSASVNATTKYVDWDEISIIGTHNTPNSTSASMGDGVWYFNIRSVDATGNWNPTATSIGPFWIESYPPISTTNIPAGWVTSFPSVSITATDAGSGVKYTKYQYDGAAWTTYTVPFAPGVDGTHTLNFYSVDNVGHIETTHTATVRLDTTPPSTPTSIGASAVSTTSVEVSWAPSTDTVSGIAYYAVYRNGSLVGTTTAGPYTDTGLNAGSTYTYYVVAYNGASSPSSNSTTASATTPQSEIWMSLSTDTVSMGTLNPGAPSTVASATTVKVGGIGTIGYDLWCSAVDFSNAASGSPTPTMPVNSLSYATNGWVSLGQQPFTLTPYKLDTASGVKYTWEHDYRFDYVLNPPWANDPGTYTTTVTYTVVSH